MAVFTRKFRRKLKFFMISLILPAVVFGYAYFIEPNSLVTKDQAIQLSCLKEDQKNNKIVQLSDFHFTEKTTNGRVDQIYEATVEANPTAVFMTGDYTSNKGGLPMVKKLVGKISAKFPVYAVLGNWDYDVYSRDMSEIQKALEGSGARVLINSMAKLKIGEEEISLIGVRDPYNSKDTKEDLGAATKKIGKGDKDCKVLLAHSPDIVKVAEDKKIDLVLTGHTHGGQINIPYLTERIMPANPDGKGYIKGLYKVGNLQMYVNQGIGLSVLPLRFGVPPEVTVITLSRPVF